MVLGARYDGTFGQFVKSEMAELRKIDAEEFGPLLGRMRFV